MARKLCEHISLESDSQILASVETPVVFAGSFDDDLVDMDNLSGMDPDRPDPENFVDEVTPTEWPSMKQEVEIVASVEASVEDLSFLVEDIKKAKGISIEHAAEAHRLLPDHFKIPLGYYTKTPSKTQYKASMEGIVEGIKKFMVKMYQALRAMIQKFIDWILGRKSSEKSPHALPAGETPNLSTLIKEDFNTAFAKLNEKHTVFKNIRTVVDELELHVENAHQRLVTGGFNYVTMGHSREWFRDLEMFMEDMNFKKGGGNLSKMWNMCHGDDSLYHEIMSNGPYFNAVENNSIPMRDASNHLRACLQLMNDVFTNPKKDWEPYQDNMLKQITETPFENKIERFKEMYDQLSNKPITPTAIPLNQLLVPVTKFFHSMKTSNGYMDAKEVLTTVKEVDGVFHEMQKVVESPNDDDLDAYVKLLLKLAQATVSQVTIAMRVVHSYFTYMYDFGRICKSYVNMVSSLLAHLQTSLHVNDDDSDAVKARDELSAISKDYYRAVKEFNTQIDIVIAHKAMA